MEEKQELLMKFSSNMSTLISLLSECVGILDQRGIPTINSALLGIGDLYLKNQNQQELLDNLIYKSYEKCWDQIYEKNETFFIENAGIIFAAFENHVSVFKVIFTAVDANGQKIIGDDIREDIWLVLKGIVSIAIKYIHNGRGPMPGPRYTLPFFDMVNLSYHIPKWEINVTFDRRI